VSHPTLNHKTGPTPQESLTPNARKRDPRAPSGISLDSRLRGNEPEHAVAGYMITHPASAGDIVSPQWSRGRRAEGADSRARRAECALERRVRGEKRCSSEVM